MNSTANKEVINHVPAAQPGSPENPVAVVQHTENHEKQLIEAAESVGGQEAVNAQNSIELDHLLEIMGNKEHHQSIGEAASNEEVIHEIKHPEEPVLKKFVNGVSNLVEEIQYGPLKNRGVPRFTSSKKFLKSAIDRARGKGENLVGEKNKITETAPTATENPTTQPISASATTETPPQAENAPQTEVPASVQQAFENEPQESLDPTLPEVPTAFTDAFPEQPPIQESQPAPAQPAETQPQPQTTPV